MMTEVLSSKLKEQNQRKKQQLQQSKSQSKYLSWNDYDLFLLMSSSTSSSSEFQQPSLFQQFVVRSWLQWTCGWNSLQQYAITISLPSMNVSSTNTSDVDGKKKPRESKTTSWLYKRLLVFACLSIIAKGCSTAVNAWCENHSSQNCYRIYNILDNSMIRLRQGFDDVPLLTLEGSQEGIQSQIAVEVSSPVKHVPLNDGHPRREILQAISKIFRRDGRNNKKTSHGGNKKRRKSRFTKLK